MPPGRRGAAAHALRLPGRALEAPANVKRHRVAFRDREAASARDEGGGLEEQGAPHGLQAARHGAAALAEAERRRAASARPCGSPFRRWSSSGAREEGNRPEGKGRLITKADPQLLTITRKPRFVHASCALLLPVRRT